jgi:hypothetical protein
MTFLHVVPIEAPCYAVRLGFATGYNAATVIAKASVYPSDSYSVLTANGNAALIDAGHDGPSYPVVPTGGAQGSRVYFDNEGQFNTTVNTSGTNRSFTIPAVVSNPNNTGQGFAVQWSDLVPCSSVPRADGGLKHLLFIYVTISSPDMTVPVWPQTWVMAGNPLASRGGRYFWGGYAERWNADFADNPTGTRFFPRGFMPLWAVQYLTANPGIQTVVTGDSQSEGPTDDGFTTPLMRAGWDLSTPGLPIEYACMAWGGKPAAVYNAMLSNNMAALRPSIAAHQPLSRNDGWTNMHMLLAASLAFADQMSVAYGTKTIWNMAGCECSAAKKSTSMAAFTDMRGRLLELAMNSGAAVIDTPSVIGNVANGAPWDYLPGYSNDASHINYAGAEALVPQARAILRKLIGIE